MALRQLFRGRIWSITPATVVVDDGATVALWLPPDVEGKTGDGDLLGDWSLRDVRWTERRRGILRITEVGEHASTLFFWDDDGAFQGWYVNLEQPMTRTSVGFDFEDLILDLWIGVDKQWRWLDVEEFNRARELELLKPAEVEETRAAGERALAAAIAGDPPFGAGWEEWQPDPGWPCPTLDPAWIVAPVKDGAHSR